LPAYQTFQFAIRKRTGIVLDEPLGDCGGQQRTYVTMEFVLKRLNKVGKPRTETGDTDGFNSFLPGILIIGGDRKNFFEEHLRSQIRAVRGEFRAAVTTQHAASHDSGR